MAHRTAFLFVFMVFGGLGALGLACSSSSNGGGGGDDSGTDGSTDSAHHDGAGDAASQDGGSMDTGTGEAAGNCSPLKGACDIVSQDCPQGKECVVGSAPDGGFTAVCVSTSVGQHIAKGEACSTQNPNPCLPGLECFSGRCTPHCCKGDDSVCGMSSDGLTGTCDLNISSGPPSNTSLFMVCTYKQVCKPFKVLPCMPSQTCLVEDKLGTSDCTVINGAGKAEGATCMYKNDCADGLMCLGVQGMQPTCQMLCLTPNSMPPFDAGADGGPGRGGCNTGKTCTGALDPNQFPPWLSICK